MDVRSVCGLRGGCGAREDVEEANAREAGDEEAVAGAKFSTDACGERWTRANIREVTSVSECFGNDT